MLRPVFALLALVTLLALPGAALAQSAGDDQYSDPFADSDGQSGGGQGGNAGGGDGGSSGGDTGRSSGGDAPVSSAPATPSAPDTPGAAASAPGAESGSGTLPRTGFEIVLLLAAAFPLVVGGVALRRVAADP